MPLGGAGLPGHADGFLQATERDLRLQQQQGDVIVHVEFVKVLVKNHARDPFYLQGWAL